MAADDTGERPRGRGNLRALVIVLACILAVDLVGAAAAYVVHHNDPIALPVFRIGNAPRSDAVVEFPIPPRVPLLELVPYEATSGIPPRPRTPEDAARTALELLSRRNGSPTSADAGAAGRALVRATRDMHNGLIPHAFAGLSTTNVPVSPPWYSAEAQAMALSAAVQLAEATADRRWRELADQLFIGLTTFRDFRRFGLPSPGDPWTSLVDDDQYLWFERTASASNPSFSFTGHMSAVLALDGYWRLTRTSTAKRLFRGGVATVAHYFDEFRIPGAPARDGLPDGIRDAARQDLMAAQLDALATSTGDDRFTGWAAKLRRDLTLPPLVDARTVASGPVAGVDGYPRGGMDASRRSNECERVPSTQDPDLVLTYALNCLARARTSQDPKWRVRAEAAVNSVQALSSGGLYAHLSPARNLEYLMTPPWFSAQTQGLMLSAQSRLLTITKDEAWRRAAARTFATLLFHREEQYAPKGQVVRWISVVDDHDYLWFERFPQSRVPSLEMAGHLYATFGVYDYWAATREPVAAQTFRAAVATMVRYLPETRVEGQPSRIGMATGEQSLVQHLVVTRQVRVLGQMSGRRDLSSMANALLGDAS